MQGIKGKRNRYENMELQYINVSTIYYSLRLQPLQPKERKGNIKAHRRPSSLAITKEKEERKGRLEKKNS